MWSFLTVVFSTTLTTALAVVSVVSARRAAYDARRWDGRQESYALLRWAVEITLGPDLRRQRTGLGILTALSRSGLIDPEDAGFVFAVLRTVTTQTGVPQ